jgi:hypothetical protein
VVASEASVVLGPARTPLAISACKLYGEVGLPIIATTLHADALTANRTTFRTVISTGEIGEALADYLGIVLNAHEARVFTIDNRYGRPLAARFRAGAERQGLGTSDYSFRTTAERDAIAVALGAADHKAPIILGMEYEDAAPVLVALRRQGYRGLVLGTATMARANFNGLFAHEPEEQGEPGYFTEGVHAASPCCSTVPTRKSSPSPTAIGPGSAANRRGRRCRRTTARYWRWRPSARPCKAIPRSPATTFDPAAPKCWRRSRRSTRRPTPSPA